MRANATRPLPVTAPETSKSLNPVTTRCARASAPSSGGRRDQSPGHGSSPVTRCTATRAGNGCQLQTRRVARTRTTSGGSSATTNSNTASRRPLGLPSQSCGQLASAVSAPVSPSWST
ncbi:hypothetical protein AB0H57_12470 [Micromonospora sp. NPDC050686]|uniref:hypothetical protein n=1 Tax=Micromonospora sp. NPDC050686 TaxID=3154631 RepID=UPI0033CC92E7